MKFVRETLFSVLFLVTLSAAAQHLVPEYHIKSAGSAYHKMAVDAAGNFYVFGHFDDLNGENHGRLLKLDPSGNLVSSFQKIYADDAIYDALIQPDGKILISGPFTEINGQAVPHVLRLNTDGSIDGSFSCPLNYSGDMELQSTGKIVVLTTQGVFERLNSDGSIDQSFNFQNYVSGFAEYEIGPDNSIYFASFSVVHKLTPEGVDDNSFTSGSGALHSIAGPGAISALEVQADGKIVVGGFFDSYSGVSLKSIIRLNADGSIDNTFTPGNNIEGQLFDIVQRSNGKLLIGGQAYQYAGQAASLVELNTNGTFSRNIAVVSINNIEIILEGPDSRTTIVGSFTVANGISTFGTCRFNANYTIDQSFAPKITFNNSNGLRVVVDDAMRTTMMGNSEFIGIYNGTSLVKGKVLRASASGSYDATFASNIVPNAYIVGGGIQSDGKVIVSGYLGSSSWQVARLNSNGSQDATFNIGTGATTNGTSTVLYAVEEVEDLIFLGGSFTHFNGIPSKSLVAVNKYGQVVKTFTSLPANSQVNRIAMQSTGKIILTGYFTFGSQTFYIVRLNTDGSIDEAFHRPTMLQSSSDMEIDQYDNIYLSGESLWPDGSHLESLIRLTPDGDVDGSFNIGSGFGDPWPFVTAIELLPDGRIAVGGHFNTVQGVQQPGFAILDVNGTLVPQQDPFFGKGSAAVDMFFRKGQLFLAGKFKTPDYTNAYSFVRVHVEEDVPFPPTNLSVSLTNAGSLSLSWTINSTNQDAFVIERSVGNLDTFIAIDTVAASVNKFTDTIDPFDFHAYRVRAYNEIGASDYSNIDSLTWIPAGPSGTITLSASVSAPFKTTLSWDAAVVDNEGFVVEYAIGDNSTFELLDTLTADADGYIHTIARNTGYHYRVRGYNQFGSLSSNTVLIEWLPVPEGSITLTIATSSEGKPVLSWTGNAKYHDGFSIVRSLQSDTGYLPIDSVNDATFSFTDASAVKNLYYYKVVAYNANGTLQSTSGEWARPPQGSLELSASTPKAPEVTLTWKGTTLYNHGFIIEYRIGSNVTYQTLDTVSASTNTFTHAIGRNIKYNYRVKAYNEAGTSSSQPVSVEWLPLPEGNLTLEIATASAGEATLSWNNNINYHDGFIIERSLQEEGGYESVGNVGPTATTFTDITNGRKVYYYRVVASNVNGTMQSNTVAMVITGIESAFENELNVFPIPAKESVTVSAANNALLNNISLIDRNGSVMLHCDNLSTSIHGIDLSALAPGVYVIRTTINGKQLTKRIVKE